MCSVMSDSLQPMDCTLPGSSVHGVFQARILEWVAISFSRGPSRSRDRALAFRVSCPAKQILLPLVLPGKPTRVLQGLTVADAAGASPHPLDL